MKTLIQRAFLLMPIIILVINDLQSQEYDSSSNFFLETKSNQLNKSDFASKYAIDYDGIRSFYSAKVNPVKLLKDDDISIKINNDIITIKKNKLIKHGLSAYSFFGNTEGNKVNNAVITLRGDNIVGTIYLDSITYRIASFKDNEYYLIGINDIAFECGTIDNIEKNTKNNTINEKQTLEKLNLSLNSKDIQNSSLSPMATSSVNACNMRVLVMYTPAAKALVSDIQNTIEHEMDLSNQYMENSGVNETWELAFTGLTIYTEALDDRNQDLGRFRATYEGYMDEVHNLRAKYSADVCVLISKCTGNCGGVAAHIYATPAYAFCLVHIDVLGTDPWVFAHEIGHVIACRHEVSKDSLMTPYAYVHGYVNADTSFTTIMATIPPHIPYWSNPNIYYDGEPIGTASYNNCALALTQKIPEKVKFLQPVSDITITSTEVNNMSFGDVISEQTATLSGITVQNGSTLKVRSNYVTINNGFTAQLGAELEIINEAVLDCP